jgi:hypothetical protein
VIKVINPKYIKNYDVNVIREFYFWFMDLQVNNALYYPDTEVTAFDYFFDKELLIDYTNILLYCVQDACIISLSYIIDDSTYVFQCRLTNIDSGELIDMINSFCNNISFL